MNTCLSFTLPDIPVFYGPKEKSIRTTEEKEEKGEKGDNGLFFIFFYTLTFYRTVPTLRMEWCFTPLSTVFQSYNGNSSHFSCLSWVTTLRKKPFENMLGKIIHIRPKQKKYVILVD